MKNTEKNIVELNAQLNGVEERVKEIKNELDTLDFQMELYRIDAKLYRMKRKTLMYELELLDKKIGNAVNDKTFKAVFLTENFKMIHGTYNIDVSSAGLAHFINEAGDLEYFIAIEAKDSTFGG